MTSSWEPSPEDLAWTQSLLNSLKDGGYWAIPVNCSIYVFNKQKKTYRVTAGDIHDETNQRVIFTLGRLGYLREIGAENEQANTEIV